MAGATPTFVVLNPTVRSALSFSDVSAALALAVSVCMLVAAAATPSGAAADAARAAAPPAAAVSSERRERGAVVSSAIRGPSRSWSTGRSGDLVGHSGSRPSRLRGLGHSPQMLFVVIDGQPQQAVSVEPAERHVPPVARPAGVIQRVVHPHRVGPHGPEPSAHPVQAEGR